MKGAEHCRKLKGTHGVRSVAAGEAFACPVGAGLVYFHTSH